MKNNKIVVIHYEKRVLNDKNAEWKPCTKSEFNHRDSNYEYCKREEIKETK